MILMTICSGQKFQLMKIFEVNFMINFLKNHWSEILSAIAAICAGGITIKICRSNIKKRHIHAGDNVAKNGSVAADNINATINIINEEFPKGK